MKKTMFREYDIRGRVSDDELNDESVEIIAKAYGTLMRREKGFEMAAVGYDSRRCSPGFRDAVVRGLNAVGVSTVDIGLATTPVLYFAQYLTGLPAGVMITGSHNPDGWSGFKLANGFSSTLLTDDIQQLYRLIERGDFADGSGQSFRMDSIKEAYVSALKWRVKPEKRLKIVIDCGNGTAGAFAPALFRAAGFDVVETFCELDPSFPHHFPNPSELESLADLRAATVSLGADLGLAFDGDGDRLGVIDEQGNIISADRVLLLLARQVLEKKPGARIVFDVKCTQALPEDIEAHGGEPVMWKTGHSYIKKKIFESGAALGGEQSGHIFFVENYYAFDDGLYAGLRLAEYLSCRDRPLSEIMRTTKQYISSPNMQAHCPDEKKYAVVEALVAEFKAEYGAENVIDINGARVKFPNGWGLVRASSNVPALVVMLEATDQESYRGIKGILRSKLSAFPEVAQEWENDFRDVVD